MSYRRILAERIGILVVLVVYYLLGYMALNAFNQERTYYVDVALPFEANIPFEPLSGIPYSLVFCTIVLGFHSIPVARHAYFKLAAKLFLVNVSASFVLFLAVPVRALHRPEIVDLSSLVGQLAAFWFYFDQPANLFPSLHVNVAVICTLVGWHHHRPLGVLNGLIAIGVAVGAIFMKQHYLADVVAGAVLGTATWWWMIGRHGERSLEPVEAIEAERGSLPLGGLTS